MREISVFSETRRLDSLRLVFHPGETDKKKPRRIKGMSSGVKIMSLSGGSNDDYHLAHLRGFEPLTPDFVGLCSVQLSYRCVNGISFYLTAASTNSATKR